MKEISDQQLEKILLEQKLITDKQLRECREILDNPNSRTTLYKIVTQKKLVNPRTLERACRHVKLDERELFEYQWLQHKSGGKPLPDVIAEKKYMKDRETADKERHRETLSDAERTFLKVAVFNKILTDEQVATISRKAIESSDPVWQILVRENIISARAANAILEKLEERFGETYRERAYTEDGFSGKKDREHFSRETQRIMKDSWLWKSE